MRRDEIYEVIRNDRLLITYGNYLTNKHQRNHDSSHVRALLRRMARFLLHMKSKDAQIKDLASLYQPRLYLKIIDDLNNFGEIDAHTGFYDKPTIPSAFGTVLKYIAHVYISQCIMD